METLNITGDDGIGFKCSRYLHRYLPINENLIKSLVLNYLWFSNPLDFNDPYDCNLEERCDCSFEEVLGYLKTVNTAHGHNASEQYLIQRAKMLADDSKEMARRSKAANMDTISQLGVCCLSERDDSLLMWSHYADKHSGVCLTFDIRADWDFFSKQLFKVEYPETYPVHRFPADYGKYNSYRFLIATKSKEWEYESEVRVVRDKENCPYRGQVHFDKSSLVKITFGHKCTAEARNEVDEILHRVGNYEHVKFYVSKLKKLTFGVDVHEVCR